MPSARRSQEEELPAVISVSEMAEAFGISRRRWYELIDKGKVPPPVYETEEPKRPVYTRELQEVCLRIRTTGVAFDGKPILFNRRRADESGDGEARNSPRRRRGRTAVPTTPQSETSRYAGLVEQLAQLGVAVGEAKVEEAIRTSYPSGTAGLDEADVITTLFRHFRRRSAGPRPAN